MKGHEPIDTISETKEKLRQAELLSDFHKVVAEHYKRKVYTTKRNILIFGVFYTLIVIWGTLVAIRNDVAQQLNKAHELRAEHVLELRECYRDLGVLYQTN